MSWDVQKFAVEIALLEPMLGTVPAQSSIWAEHIAAKQSKALKKEGMTDDEIKAEIASTIEGVADVDSLRTGLTTFMCDANGYFVRDYFLKGFFKSAAKVRKEFGSLKQLRSKVVSHLFIRPRAVYIASADAELEIIERPLRASTPQGERTAIARSHCVPAGTRLSFQVHLVGGVLSRGCLETLLEFGAYEGLGQWRGAGNGSFEVVSLTEI